MDRTTAQQLLLRTFRWTGGHADFADVLRDPTVLASIGPALAAPFVTANISAVVAIEARGFVLGGLVARELGTWLVLARKPGAVHPDADREVATTPDWRGRHVEIAISRSAVHAGDRLLLVDDWIETGSQASTVASLVGRRSASVVGVSVLVDDTTDDVRRDLHVIGLVRSSELPPDN